MASEFTIEAYESMITGLFSRFQSFQSAGKDAYKPGLERMEFLDQLAGHPHRKYKTIHIAGTNGKGSTSNMLAAALSATGKKVGLYTSPHILDFRERMRVITSDGVQLISREDVWNFVRTWDSTFDNLGLSFFEITTMMAFDWFAKQGVDIAVIECGLGGRMDSTNLISPELSIITNIGFDHCDILGNSLGEIAFEKAGIIKPKIPVVVGESNPETDIVFERKVLYTNLPEPDFMGDRNMIMSLLTFADKVEPRGWENSAEILAAMDLQGSYQKKNLRTVLAALERLDIPLNDSTLNAIENTASVADFHGRWERLSASPLTLCDIGHNAHGLRYNFAQLNTMLDEGKASDLILVYGTVADKDVDAVLKMLPERANIIFTAADSHRAMPAATVAERFSALGRTAASVRIEPKVSDAVALARQLAGSMALPLIYIGGSTYVVSEAIL